MDTKTFLIETSPTWIPWLVGIASVIGAVFAQKLNKQKIAQVEACVKFVEEKFGKNLGTKADALLLVWVAALDEINTNGKMTPGQMYDMFMEIVNKKLALKSITLSSTEQSVVHEAASETVKMLSVDPKRTVKAFQVSSIQR